MKYKMAYEEVPIPFDRLENIMTDFPKAASPDSPFYYVDNKLRTKDGEEVEVIHTNPFFCNPPYHKGHYSPLYPRTSEEKEIFPDFYVPINDTTYIIGRAGHGWNVTVGVYDKDARTLKIGKIINYDNVQIFAIRFKDGVYEAFLSREETVTVLAPVGLEQTAFLEQLLVKSSKDLLGTDCMRIYRYKHDFGKSIGWCEMDFMALAPGAKETYEEDWNWDSNKEYPRPEDWVL